MLLLELKTELQNIKLKLGLHTEAKLSLEKCEQNNLLNYQEPITLVPYLGLYPLNPVPQISKLHL